MTTNIVIDGAFLFGISFLFERMGFYHFVTRTRWMVLIDWLVVSLIAYGYQMWQSGAFKRQDNNDGITMRRLWLRRKAT